jgi:hypothetical protein
MENIQMLDQIQKISKKFPKIYENNYELINIWEDDWFNKPNIVKSMLNYKLNNIKNKINARDCIIKEVDTVISHEFLDKNHLQGKCVDSIRYGIKFKFSIILEISCMVLFRILLQ